MKRFLKFILLSLLILLCFTSCGKKSIEIKNLSISEDTKFGSATINISIEDFNKKGFNLGDSVNLSFTNGFKLEDIPYFDGYYVKTGEPVLVAYPNSKNILVTYNNIGIWDSAELQSDTLVSIKLNKKKKYIVTEEALGQTYSVIRSEYTSDAEFANFRALKGGKLKDNFIYRGASPVDNSRNRASIVDNLLKENEINTVIDLADSKDNMDTYLSDNSYSFLYTKSLYENNKMILLSMSSSFSKDEYKQSVVKGCRFMLNSSGKYYIHCMEGKDRTGFVCLLLEALAEGTYNELMNDYMITYYNYYKISENTVGKYNAVVDLYFNSFITYLCGNDNIEECKNLNYKEYAIKYLKDGGMTDSEIDSFIKLITNGDK